MVSLDGRLINDFRFMEEILDEACRDKREVEVVVDR